jgi:hypothetical protein
MSLSIKTAESSNKGAYDLLFDYYLSDFVTNSASKHKKEIVKLTASSSKLEKPAIIV